MAQKVKNPEPANVNSKRRVYIRLLFCFAFAVFGLHLYDGMTGKISGGYPFLNMAIKQKESEAKQFIGSINRAQQAYFVRKGKFTTAIADLGLDIPLETSNYRYRILPLTDSDQAIATSSAKNEDLKIYVGAVRQITPKDGKRTIVAILCGSPRSQRHSLLYGRPKPLALPSYSQEDNQLHCGEGTLDLGR